MIRNRVEEYQQSFIPEGWVNIDRSQNRLSVFLRIYPFAEKFEGIREEFERRRYEERKKAGVMRKIQGNQEERHFDFYEPFTVHESSLSPCVHSIHAANLGQIEQAYEFYLRTSRLDLDDYNKEVHEGLHITSMAGTWMSIVEGFGGMRVKNDILCFTPRIPDQWDAYSFKINYRGQILHVKVHQNETNFELEGDNELQIMVNDRPIVIRPNNVVTVE